MEMLALGYVIGAVSALGAVFVGKMLAGIGGEPQEARVIPPTGGTAITPPTHQRGLTIFLKNDPPVNG